MPEGRDGKLRISEDGRAAFKKVVRLFYFGAMGLLINQLRGGAEPIPKGPVGLFYLRPLKYMYPTIIYTKKHIMAFGTLLWKSVILTSVTLLLRDIAGIGSAPQNRLYTDRKGEANGRSSSAHSQENANKAK